MESAYNFHHNFPGPKEKVARHIVKKDYRQRSLKYNSEDILIVCNNESFLITLSEYISKLKIKSSDPLDEGRNISYTFTNSPSNVVNLINSGKTYGFILTDIFFEHDMAGRELVRLARNNGYNHAIIYISEPCFDPSIENFFMNVGADALLVKGTKTMKIEIVRLIRDLIFRKHKI